MVFRLILGACGGAGTAVTQVETVEAAAMRLVRTEGEVALSDEAEEHIPIVENMRLFSGNALATGTESRAGISLDEAKTVTLGGETPRNRSGSRNTGSRWPTAGQTIEILPFRALTPRQA